MQPSPGKGFIVAHFPTSNAAYQTSKLLQSAGLGAAKIDPVSPYGANEDPKYENPLNSTQTDTLSAGYSYTYSTGQNLTGAERLINITNPSASDYINSDSEAVLTLSVSDAKSDQAVEIIKNNGGVLRAPSTDTGDKGTFTNGTMGL